MTQVLVKCLCLALVPCAATAVAAPSASHPAVSHPVALFLDFDHSPSPVIVAGMKTEVQRIFSTSGLQFEWHMLAEPSPGSEFATLAVIHVKGECSVPSLLPAGDDLGGAALASTPVSGGNILHFTDLECSRVGEYIAPLLSGSPQSIREQVLGRAMGRILAHELYHIFTGNQQHADGGIARSFHRRQELVAPRFDFEAAESEEFRDFRAAMEPAARPQEPDPGIDVPVPDDGVSSAGR